MAWWRLLRRRGLGESPDYYREAVKLANEQKHHEALTSFRLALKQRPNDPEIMQQMGVVYTHIGMPDEAIKLYEETIKTGSNAPAAHYGLAFLLLKTEDVALARRHLTAFLAQPPIGDEATAHIEHARRTLEQLDAEHWATPQTDDPAGA